MTSFRPPVRLEDLCAAPAPTPIALACEQCVESVLEITSAVTAASCECVALNEVESVEQYLDLYKRGFVQPKGVRMCHPEVIVLRERLVSYFNVKADEYGPSADCCDIYEKIGVTLDPLCHAEFALLVQDCLKSFVAINDARFIYSGSETLAPVADVVDSLLERTRMLQTSQIANFLLAYGTLKA